ncbi:MAG: ParB N-terminal domain-containing protein [Pseudomonadota bacterium]
MRETAIPIDEIYIPAKLRGSLDPNKVETVAEGILSEGDHEAISVRQGNGRYVLVRGIHRLEAMKALGESEIKAILVAARQF